MKKSLIFFAAFLLVGCFAIPAFAGPFTDVPTDHWAYEAIDSESQSWLHGKTPDEISTGRKLRRAIRSALPTESKKGKYRQSCARYHLHL
jgi:hypothetical protein